MTRHIVARTTEIPPGGNKVVDVDGRDIVVFHVNGEFFALLNRCPHAGAPLEKAAKLAGRVSGDSTVAYAIAFASAVESALGLEPPPRASRARARTPTSR